MAKRKHLRFTIRFLLALVLISSVPCWWIGSNISEFQMEARIIGRIDKIAPDLHVEYEYCGPSWTSTIGWHPKWLNRVRSVDVIGFRNGKTLTIDDVPFDFDDESFLAIQEDLIRLNELRMLFLWYTKLTDDIVVDLEDFQTLEVLQLNACNNMTNAAVKRLQSKLTNTEIHLPLRE